MTKDSQINFRFFEENSWIVLAGALGNLPKLTLVHGDFIFKLWLSAPVIHCVQAVRNPQRRTLVGHKALYEFNKLRLSDSGSGEIIFKRTSQIYQLCLFAGYFVVLTLFMVFVVRRNLFEKRTVRQADSQVGLPQRPHLPHRSPQERTRAIHPYSILTAITQCIALI
jgi:hypothetical protein